MGLLGKVVAAGTPIVVGVWGFLKLWNKKADRHTVNNQFQELKGEQTLHRSYFKDVFEKMEAHARRDDELFREVLGTMHTHHSEILRELGKKADR